MWTKRAGILFQPPSAAGLWKSDRLLGRRSRPRQSPSRTPPAPARSRAAAGGSCPPSAGTGSAGRAAARARTAHPHSSTPHRRSDPPSSRGTPPKAAARRWRKVPWSGARTLNEKTRQAPPRGTTAGCCAAASPPSPPFSTVSRDRGARHGSARCGGADFGAVHAAEAARVYLREQPAGRLRSADDRGFLPRN